MNEEREKLNSEIDRKLKALSALRHLKSVDESIGMKIYELERQVDELVDQYADMTMWR